METLLTRPPSHEPWPRKPRRPAWKPCVPLACCLSLCEAALHPFSASPVPQPQLVTASCLRKQPAWKRACPSAHQPPCRRTRLPPCWGCPVPALPLGPWTPFSLWLPSPSSFISRIIHFSSLLEHSHQQNRTEIAPFQRKKEKRPHDLPSLAFLCSPL